jgi:hypothetical protein
MSGGKCVYLVSHKNMNACSIVTPSVKQNGACHLMNIKGREILNK